MNTERNTHPPLSDKPFRLRGLPATDVHLSPDGVSTERWIWWFLAPGNRDLWLAVGRTRQLSATAGRSLLLHGARRRALRHRCTVLGLPWAVVAADPQRVAELQLITLQSMRRDLLQRMAAHVNDGEVQALRDGLIDDAILRRPTLHV